MICGVLSSLAQTSTIVDIYIVQEHACRSTYAFQYARLDALYSARATGLIFAHHFGKAKLWSNARRKYDREEPVTISLELFPNSGGIVTVVLKQQHIKSVRCVLSHVLCYLFMKKKSQLVIGKSAHKKPGQIVSLKKNPQHNFQWVE